MTRIPTTPTRPASERAPGGSRPSRPAPKATVDPVRVIRQNLTLLIVTIIVGAGLGVIANYAFKVLYPLYLGEARIEVRNQLTEGRDVLTQDRFTEEGVARVAQTEAAHMVARGNLLEALKSPDVRSTAWAEGFRDQDGAFDAEEAADRLIEELRAGHRRGQQIFFLSWRAHEARDVPIVVNAIMDSYVERRRKDDELTFSNTAEVFQKQEQSLNNSILELKRAIEEYVREKNLKSLDEKGDAYMNEELKELGKQMSESKKDYDVARARQIAVERRLEGTMEFSAEDIRNAEGDPSLMEARRALHERKTQLASLRGKFGPDHPNVVSLEAIVESSEQTLKTERDVIIQRNLRADLKKFSEDAVALEALLERQQKDYVAQSQQLETVAVSLTELKNMKDRLSQLEDERKVVRERIGEISTVRAREDASRIRVVQRASEPRELDFPKLKVMIPVTVILVLGLVLLIIFTREFLDQRVRYTSDLAGLPGGRLLGVIPELSDDPVAPKKIGTAFRDQPNSVIAESIRQTAVAIAKNLEGGHKAIMVTTPMPGGGVTSIVANLAAVAGAMVGKVLVIDANLRQPQLASVLGGSDTAPGLSDILAGNGTLASTVQSIGGLYILGAGSPAARMPERLNGAKFAALLEEAKAGYDIVLLDTPPAVVAGEVMTVANRCDASILVVHAWNDQRGLVARLAHQLLDVRSLFLGVILNRPRSTAGGYFKRNAEAIAQYAKARS